MAPLNSTLRYNDATYNLTDCLLSISDISIVSPLLIADCHYWELLDNEGDHIQSVTSPVTGNKVQDWLEQNLRIQSGVCSQCPE